MVNLAWLSAFSSYSLIHLPGIFLDQAPLLLYGSPNPHCGKYIFRFNNFCLDYIGCPDAVRDACSVSLHGNPIHTFAHLLFHARFKVISWSNASLTPLDITINEIEVAIKTLKEVDDFDPDKTSSLLECYSRFASL